MTGQYKFINTQLGTSYTNNTDNFEVVVGIDNTSLTNDGDSINIQDAAGTVYDGFKLRTFGVAADEIMIGIPRRMLLPPGMKVVQTNSKAMLVVLCKADTPQESLRMALDIL